MSARTALAGALGAALLAAACGPQGARAATPFGPLVVVEAPAGAARSPLEPGAFRDPWPAGSRVVVRAFDDPTRELRTLSAGLEAAGGVRIDPGGERVLFCGRRAGETWRAWIAPVTGGEAQAVSPAEANTVAADWLPDGRLVLSCDLGAWRDPRDGEPAFALYTVHTDGSALERIGFSPSSQIDPEVLADGRVLFSAWQPPGIDRPAGGWALFTVREDGTGLLPFRGSHDGAAAARRPRQIEGRVVYLALDRDGRARPLAARMARPTLDPVALAGPDEEWRSIERAPDGRLLVARRGDGRPGFGLFLAAPDGALEELLDDPRVDELEALRALPRDPPRGHLSVVDPAASTGELLILDARRTLLPRGAPLPQGRATTLVVERVLPGRLPAPADATSAALALPRRETLVRRALAEDGSVLLEVPADTPLVLSTEDEHGNRLLDSAGWIWVRPAEKRACIGCHEDRESAPVNRLVDALPVRAVASTPPSLAAGAAQ